MRPVPVLTALVAIVVALLLYFFYGGESAPGGPGSITKGTEAESATTPEGDLPPGSTPAGTDTESGQRTELVGSAGEAGAEEVPVAAPKLTNELVGTVVDHEGVGIPGCELMLLPHGSGAFSWNESIKSLRGQPVARTDDLGRYSFKRVPPGDDNALLVRHPEIALLIVNGVIVGESGVFQEPPIVLRYGKRLRGKVETEFGFPAEGAVLHLDARWIPMDPQPSLDRLSAVTDADGNYEILGIPDGTRCLTVSLEGFGTITRIQSLIFSDKTGQAHVANFKLQAEAMLAGHIVDEKGMGIEGVDVLAVDRAAYREVGHSRALSGPDGAFSISSLPPGTYALSARAEGYYTKHELDVATPQEEFLIVLGRQPGVRGRVVDGATGAPLTNFSVRLRMEQLPGMATSPYGEFRSVAGSAGGEFEIPEMPPEGVLAVEAKAPGYAPTISPTFQAEAPRGVDGIVVEMTRGALIHGRLVDSTGKGVSGALVESRDSSWRDDAFSDAMGGMETTHATRSKVWTDGDGRFRLTNLSPATYQVSATHANFHRTAQRGIELAEGDELDLGDIPLSVGGSLRGIVLDAESTPVEGAMVFMQPRNVSGGGIVRRAKSRVDGSWGIANIAPGTYALSAKPPVRSGEPGDDAFALWPTAAGEVISISPGTEDSRDIFLDAWTTPAPVPAPAPVGSVGGKVLGADGRGITGAAVKLVPVDVGMHPEYLSKSEREGEFSFTRVQPGEYVLSSGGADSPSHRVTVRADVWTRQDLQLAQ